MRISPRFVAIIAGLLFGIGLTGPLTPSEGAPSFLLGLLFWLLPLTLVTAAFRFSHTTAERLIAGIVFVVIGGFAFWGF